MRGRTGSSCGRMDRVQQLTRSLGADQGYLDRSYARNRNMYRAICSDVSVRGVWWISTHANQAERLSVSPRPCAWLQRTCPKLPRSAS